VTHHFHKVAQAAGVKAKLHDLRHTGLTWMVARGVPLKLVQDIAGHTSINTTMGYAKTFAGGAYDVLMKAFSF
jgi:integrase